MEMNRCQSKGFKCPYALSDEAPFPCYATFEQCREILALVHILEKLGAKNE